MTILRYSSSNIITIVDITLIVNIIMNVVNTIISILKIEDMMPFFPDFVTIDHINALTFTTIVISSRSHQQQYTSTTNIIYEKTIYF